MGLGAMVNQIVFSFYGSSFVCFLFFLIWYPLILYEVAIGLVTGRGSRGYWSGSFGMREIDRKLNLTS